jgi:hypothetical protein
MSDFPEGASRRDLLIGGAAIAAAQGFATVAFGRSGAAPVAELPEADMVLAEAGAANAPKVGAAEGLKASAYLSSDDPFVAQDADLARAVQELKSDRRFSVLDLEGRTIALDRTLDIDDGDGNPFSKPLKIVNGTLIPSDKWQDPQAPLVRFFSSSKQRVARWGLEGIKMKCLNRASAIFIDGGYVNMRFRFLDIDDPARFGIRTRVGDSTGSDLRVEHCDITSNSADKLASKRVLIGLDLSSDNDGKVFGNRIQKARTAIKGPIGSFMISHNHFWQGSDVGLPRTDRTPVLHFGARSTNIVAVNYIDNGVTVLEEGLGGSGETRSMGFCQFISNIFTLAESDEKGTYISIKPAAAGRGLANMIIIGNQIRNIGSKGEKVTRPFSVDTSAGGHVNTALGSNIRIEDNYFWGKVQPQSSRVEKFIELTGKKSYPVDVTGQTPFDLDADVVTQIGVRAEADPGSVWYKRAAGRRGTLQVANPVNGKVYLALTVNAAGLFG